MPDTPPTRQETTPSRSERQVRRNVASRWVKRVLMGLLAVAIVAAIVVAWLPDPVPVDVAAAERGPLQVSVDEDGRTRVKDRHVVSAPLSGNLSRIELDPGDHVERGETVARIVPLRSPLLDPRSRAQARARVSAARAARRQAITSVERAEVALEQAKREAERMRTLAAKGAATERELERAEFELRMRQEELASARFGVRVARSELEVAQTALGRIEHPGEETEEHMTVPSPIDGVVLRVMQSSEGVVQAGTPLLELGDPKALEVVVDVLTTDAVDIQPGDDAVIERWGGEHPLQGRVRRIEPSAFTQVSALGVEEQRVNVVVDIVDPYDEWKALGDGYRVEARIVIWEGEDVLAVPASAVFQHGDGWAVFALQDGEARLREIEVGKRSGFEVQVLKGLKPGDQVVAHPSDRIEHGTSVTPR